MDTSGISFKDQIRQYLLGNTEQVHPNTIDFLEIAALLEIGMTYDQATSMFPEVRKRFLTYKEVQRELASGQ